jgi:hypothetical protein
MGMDLKSKVGGEFSFSTIGWSFYLNLAAIYGWESVGTLPPSDWNDSRPWEGAYDWNAGQCVAEKDACGLANALDSYLADPNRKEQAENLASQFSEIGIPINLPDSDSEFVHSFIMFARNGAFEIW